MLDMPYPPDFVIPDYDHARALQSRAEQGTDPDAYEVAANAYAILGMFSNANSCYRRAEHYRKIQLKEIP